MQTHTHLKRRTFRPGVIRKGSLRRDSRPHGISRSGECYQEGIPLGVDFLPVPFGERIAEDPPVFCQDFRVPAVAEAPEERGGALDVGEEEGDRPGRQAGRTRPPT